MRLFPRIPLALARERVEELRSLDIEAIGRDHVIADHPAVWFGAVGGSRVDYRLLEEIRTTVVSSASENGFPVVQPHGEQIRQFEKNTATYLYEVMDVSPAEAANIEVWCYMTCMLLPDVVRWRFPGDADGTPVERFLGSSGGQRRNAIGRMWWRAMLFLDKGAADPFHLLEELNEDELVQITERPAIAGSRQLMREYATAAIHLAEADQRLPRRDLFRDGMKRLRRLWPILSVDTVSEDVLKVIIDRVLLEARSSLLS